MSSVNRVITGVSGSPGSLRALRYAAELARFHQAALLPVLAWMPPGGDLADRRYPSPYLRRIWQDAAAQQLADAIGLALGGTPHDLKLESAVLRGEAGRVLVAAASDPSDLLVVGAGRRGPIVTMHGRTGRYCMAHAACPVIAVPPASLAEASRGPHRWTLRHRTTAPEGIRMPATGTR